MPANTKHRQGFPDNYRFRGTVKEVGDQIANAVSPQLANAIARELLVAGITAWLRGVSKMEDASYSKNLQNFVEFCKEFAEKGLVLESRSRPVPVHTATNSRIPKYATMAYHFPNCTGVAFTQRSAQ